MSIIEQLEKRKKLLAYLNSPSNEEVFTPAKLVEEMIDKLPKELWSNPNLLWCDPCAKSGVFILEVIIRLMRNLPVKNETERYNYIINNMVKAYVNVERNKWLVSKIVYGSKDSVNRVGIIKDINKINIEDMPKFDVVVGNPPYQGENFTNNKGGNQASTALWPKFVKLSFKISLNYVALIVPKSLLKNTFFKSKLNEVYYLNIDECSKHFNVASSFTYFISSKDIDKIKTVKFFDGSKKNFKNLDFIKNYTITGKVNDISLSIISKLDKFEKISYKKGTAISINDKQAYSSEKNNKYKYKCYYSSMNERKSLFTASKFEGYGINKKLIVAHIFDFSEKNYEHFSTDEIDIGAGLQAGVLYFSKLYKKENIKKYLLSNIVKFLNIFYREGRYAYNVFRNIPSIDLSRKWTDQELYEYFDLTQEEINYIESQVKN